MMSYSPCFTSIYRRLQETLEYSESPRIPFLLTYSIFPFYTRFGLEIRLENG
jgi:hypothetical protein